ncbi:hypothetical protein CDL15_Pgr028312 [Punica granatum]|uniref:Uncharacterized protein n=1 Tax=Punica granatum TaxID=22663 RepID=A0A218W4L1_PUNGR|nr:hypothetical protein CDL15_Pgr028312 [Punica granatum]
MIASRTNYVGSQVMTRGTTNSNSIQNQVVTSNRYFHRIGIFGLTELKSREESPPNEKNCPPFQ